MEYVDVLGRISDQPATLATQSGKSYLQGKCRGNAASYRRSLWFVSHSLTVDWKRTRAEYCGSKQLLLCKYPHVIRVCQKCQSQRVGGQAAVSSQCRTRRWHVLCIGAAGCCDWDRGVLWQASSCSDGLDMPCLLHVRRIHRNQTNSLHTPVSYRVVSWRSYMLTPGSRCKF
jgi:hypothetical protein